MPEYGSTYRVTCDVDGVVDSAIMASVNRLMLSDFSAIRDSLGLPRDATMQFHASNRVDEGVGVVRDDGSPVDLDDPALDDYSDGDGGLPAGYRVAPNGRYSTIVGWRCEV